MILNVGAPGSSGSICTPTVRSVQSDPGPDYLTKERVVSKLSSPSQQWCQHCTVTGEATVRGAEAATEGKPGPGCEEMRGERSGVESRLGNMSRVAPE